MAEIKQLKEKKTDEIFYPVTVGEAVIFEDGRSVKDKIEKLSTYVETTYSNLKSLRDNNQLIPGALYRITDYVTTTTQDGTRSAGHQFDIIVQAISESTLSEDAWAIQHKFTEEDETDYFSNSNLAAWKLKYCLDNDENRFAWARGVYLSPTTHNKFIRAVEPYETETASYIYVRQPQLDNENGLAWVYDNGGLDVSIKNYANLNENLDTGDIIYTQSENIYVGQILDMAGTSITVIDFSENQGTGIIYQMVDEYNNNCPYDFKNIQFLRDASWFQNNDNDAWVMKVFYDETFIDYSEHNHYYYTFSYVNENFETRDASIKEGNKNNKVYNNTINCKNSQETKELNNIIIVTTYAIYGDNTRAIIQNNFFDYGCYNITLGNNIWNNKIEGICSELVMAGEFLNNNILYYCSYLNIVSDIYNCEFKNIEDITIGGETTFTKCTFDSTVSGQEINDGESHNDCIVLYNGNDVIIKKIYEDLSRT